MYFIQTPSILPNRVRYNVSAETSDLSGNLCGGARWMVRVPIFGIDGGGSCYLPIPLYLIMFRKRQD
jgi:hypothetical protein